MEGAAREELHARAASLHACILVRLPRVRPLSLDIRRMIPSGFRFVEDASPIRLVLGQPGSGKTTVLWKAIEARSEDRVLYPTWSRELTEQRRRASPCFAPKDVVVDTHDFVTFLGEILGAGVERRSITDSRAAFNAAVAGVRLARNQWGAVVGRTRLGGEAAVSTRSIRVEIPVRRDLRSRLGRLDLPSYGARPATEDVNILSIPIARPFQAE